jgi:glycine cleavage system pyridoxal-binding protein P
MLSAIGLRSLDDLIAHVPRELRRQASLDVPSGLGEADATRRLEELATRGVNPALLCFAGAGAYPHLFLRGGPRHPAQ